MKHNIQSAKTDSIGEILVQLKAHYQSSDKRKFDKEHYFYSWYRPISFYPTALLFRWGVSANTVTSCRAVCLLVTFVLIALGWMKIGACLYLLAYVFDFVDGNIARFTGKSTHFGKMIDGLVDVMVFLLFIVLAVGNIRTGNYLFGSMTEITIGVATGIIVLFRIYFYLRVSFILSKPKTSTSSETAVGELKLARQRSKLLQLGKQFYFGIISAMPLLLLCAVVLDYVSVYIIGYFLVFLPATLFEVVYGLRRVWLKDASSDQ